MKTRPKPFWFTAALLSAAVVWAGCFTSVQHSSNPDTAGQSGETSVAALDSPLTEAGSAPIDTTIDVPAAIDGRSDGVLDVPLTSTGGASGTGGSSGVDGTSVIIATGGIVGSGGIISTGGNAGGGGANVVIDAPVDQKLTGQVGAPCSFASDCALGNCVDGVCCATICTGCNACSGTLTGKSDGTCAPALAGLNPHKTCTDETATNQCGNDGTCDGAGACRKVSSSHVCKAAACNVSIFTPAATCDGQGACPAATPQDCSPFQCASTGCLKTCTSQTDCGGANYCKITSGTSGTCTAKNPNGTPATQTFECTSGVVADGVCCDKACTGCSACTGSPLTAAAAGQCAYVVAGQVAHSACAASGATCGPDGKCDGAGACRYSPSEGASCNDPSNLCVTSRICQNHTCTTGTTTTCPAPTQKCRNAGVCDPATGNCNYGLAAVNTTCDDSDSCTSPDLCQSNGQCVGTRILCNSPPACKLSTTCSAGACNYTQNASDGTADPNCPGTAPYCYSGACVRCTSSAQCSGVTPSCDPSTHTCVCKRPTAGNLLKNPGFDGSLANWTPNPTAVYDGNYDADGCPGSGSVYVSNGENDPYQCFPVTAGTLYYLGLRSRAGVSGGFVRIHMYAGVNCTGTVVTTYDDLRFYTPSDNTTWFSYDAYSFTPPTGVVSADIGFYSMNQWLDQIYVNTQGAYF